MPLGLPRRRSQTFLKKTLVLVSKPNYRERRHMKNIIRYHLTKNLQTPIINRISLADRLARKNAIRVGRDYAAFRNSLNIEKKLD